MRVVIDTNVILRFLVKDHVNPSLSAKSRAFFQKIEAKEITAFAPHIVITETYVILERIYHRSKSEIAQLVSPIIALESFHTIHENIILDALVTARDKNIDFVDAYLYHYAKNIEAKLASHDQDFRKFEDLRLFEL